MKAAEQSEAIRDAVMKLASVRKKATLRSLGYELPGSSSDSEDSDMDQLVFESDASLNETFKQSDKQENTSENSATEDVPCNSDLCESNAAVFDPKFDSSINSSRTKTGVQERSNFYCKSDSSMATSMGTCSGCELTKGTECLGQKLTGAIDPDTISKQKEDGMIVNPTPSMQQMLFMLRSNELNWFSFVEELRMLLQEFTTEALNEVLLDFAHYLSSSDIDKNEEHLIEQSRQAYLERERRRVMEEETSDIESDPESDNPDDWVDIDDISSKQAKEMVAKQWKILKRRARIQAAKRIAQAGFLKRKITKRVAKVIEKYPNIGKDIEDFVKEQKVGADAWRRTGVLTFSYGKNQEISGLKVTYKCIKEHLERKYQTKFAHGTIVQLCVARNKRRISAKRYKGVAKVTCRRARKGFALKLNPDAHYSTAMYSGLNKLQKKDGTFSLLLNRDDAAGFRLDTTYTHRQHSVLSLSHDVDVTTRSDYVNKYSSTLQVSSYMFLETETTPEICVGVVKAHHLHQKSPAQHMADLRMLEESSDFKDVFGKQVEFIRVDGGADEGPSHAEVQFMWTERHLSKATECLLVTTRHSGGSYLNKVELLNGCLAKAHSNLFIPSTLAGPCNSTEQLDKNLNLAIDVYVKRVNGAPCGNGTITLLKGSSSEFARHAKDRRSKLLTFLRGTKKEKKALQEFDPTLYAYFEEVWNVRSRHMVKNLPEQYVFMLVPCFQKSCPHVKCHSEQNLDLKWFPNGPSLEYFPIPIPDPNRPWGGDCSQCQGTCTGHFLSPDEHLEHYRKHGRDGMMFKPPSKILGEVHKELSTKKIELNKEKVTELAKKTLLSTDDVQMWLEHLDEVRKNRVEGAKKAAAAKTRAKSRKKGILNS